jgi:hypothetical protein
VDCGHEVEGPGDEASIGGGGGSVAFLIVGDRATSKRISRSIVGQLNEQSGTAWA